MSSNLTLEQLSRVLPKSLKHNATQEIVDKVNNIKDDPLIREAYRENLLSYTNVMSQGRFKIGNYISAVKYMTHKLMGDTDILAYTKTFPDRFQSFVDSGTTAKDIASYVTSYNKNKLVNLVREQTLIPTHILNNDMYQTALNIQLRLATDPMVSDMIKQKAADSLLMHLKAPESTKIELDVNIKTDSVIKELRESTLKLVEQQQNMLANKLVTPKFIAEAPINVIDGELDE